MGIVVEGDGKPNDVVWSKSPFLTVASAEAAAADTGAVAAGETFLPANGGTIAVAEARPLESMACRLAHPRLRSLLFSHI